MSTSTSFGNGVLTVTRTYAASREAVFDAWVETSKVQQWWGCAQTTKVVSDIEPKVGGKYIHKMTIDGAGEFPVNGVLTEYDPPELLAYEVHGPTPEEFARVRVEFIQHGDSTEVRLTHENLSEEIVIYVTPGWSAAFEKLNVFLMNEATVLSG